MGKNRLRNEKLAGYLYDLSKYAGTVVVIGKFVNADILWFSFLGGMAISITLAFVAYFITPQNENELNKENK
jgi:hypothetical protein